MTARARIDAERAEGHERADDWWQVRYALQQFAAARSSARAAYVCERARLQMRTVR